MRFRASLGTGLALALAVALHAQEPEPRLQFGGFGSLGAAAHSAPGEASAGLSLGDSPERTLAAAAAPYTVRANGCDPPRGKDRPLTTIEIEPPSDDACELPKKTSGANTRSTLFAASLTAPPLPSSVAPPPGSVTSRSRSLTSAEAAAGEGGRSVQVRVTTSGDGGCE